VVVWNGLEETAMGIGRVFFPQPVAGHPHQSVGHRQLVLPGQADVLRFGRGGVDDAEDAKVILAAGRLSGKSAAKTVSRPFQARGRLR
jgi:hypothetical protein